MKTYIVISLTTGCILFYSYLYNILGDNEILSSRIYENERSIVSQNHLKILFDNNWIFSKYSINAKGSYQYLYSQDSLFFEKVFTFNDSLITLSDKIVGFTEIQFINHIDTLKVFGKTQYNIDRYSLLLCFFANQSILSGSFKIISVSEMQISARQERTNKKTGEHEIIYIIFHAKGKAKQKKCSYRNNMLNDLFD